MADSDPPRLDRRHLLLHHHHRTAGHVLRHSLSSLLSSGVLPCLLLASLLLFAFHSTLLVATLRLSALVDRDPALLSLLRRLSSSPSAAPAPAPPARPRSAPFLRLTRAGDFFSESDPPASLRFSLNASRLLFLDPAVGLLPRPPKSSKSSVPLFPSSLSPFLFSFPDADDRGGGGRDRAVSQQDLGRGFDIDRRDATAMLYVLVLLSSTHSLAILGFVIAYTSALGIVTEKEVSGGLGLEWRVTVPEGSSVKMEPEPSWISRTWNRLVELGSKLRSKVSTFGKKVWKIGADSPRKVIHGAKVGAALTLVSLFYYLRPLYNGFGSSAMWAVMTVVVVFEYTVGGCLYKGINRAIATLSAGGLAVGIDWVASKSGENWEPVILSASVFLLASAATFSRFLPTVKARFDYGVTIFILTFSLVAVSGYRVEELINLAVQRIATIAIGIAIALSICILVYPVWSGQELHLLVSRNMEKLADSLEGCVEDYFMKSEITDAKESSATRSEGYKCVLNSKASEDSQANLARWEPAHGRFGFRHPWKQYLKVAAALRNCAYCVEALHGCINSEAKAPECMKKHLRDACMKLSSDSSKVLKELSSSIKLMKRSKSIDALVGEMKNAVHELQNAFASLPNHLTQTTASSPMESTEGKKNSNISIADGVALMEAMPLMTIASLLIEISARIQGVVDAVGTLATLAHFEGIRNEKSSSKVQAEEQEDKALQEV